MNHKVTLNETDIKEAVDTHIKMHFPGYAVSTFRVIHSKGTGPMEQDHTEIEVSLSRATVGKD